MLQRERLRKRLEPLCVCVLWMVWCVHFVVVFMMMFVKMKTTIIFLLYVARGANTVPTHLPRKRKTEACPASIGLGLLHMQWSGGVVPQAGAPRP